MNKPKEQVLAQSLSQALAIDIGTSKITLVQFDLKTMEVIQTATEANDSEVLLPDEHKHEQDPEKTWTIVQSLFTQMKDLSSVSFIAITAQVHGIILLDEAGKPHTNLITWRDARPVVLGSSKSFKQSNGCLLQKGYGGRTLVALLQEEASHHYEALHVCTIASFIMGNLSGCYSLDESIASSLGVFDIHAKCWNAPQLQELGIPLSLFPPVVPSCTPVGVVLPSVAKSLLLPSSVQVCSPIGDNQASFLGSTGFCNAGVVNIGTGGQLSVLGERENASPSVEVRPLLGSDYLEVYASLCGGWAYVYLKDFCKRMLHDFGFSVTDKEVYLTLDRLALHANPEHPLLVDTQFLGSRGDTESDQCGNISDIDTHNFTLANLSRAFLEGIARELHTPAISMEGVPFLVASGNAVRKNPLMLQLLAKEFGLPVRISPFLEEAAIGSLLGCAVQIGEHAFKEKIMVFYSQHFATNR